MIHQSEFVQTEAIVVQGETGVLLIDPGVHDDAIDCHNGRPDDLEGSERAHAADSQAG